MPNDSIFGHTSIESDFKTMGPEYTTHFNPQVATRQGYTKGLREHNNAVLKYIADEFPKPTKQMQQLITKLKEAGDKIDD